MSEYIVALYGRIFEVHWKQHIFPQLAIYDNEVRSTKREELIFGTSVYLGNECMQNLTLFYSFRKIGNHILQCLYNVKYSKHKFCCDE